MQLVEADAVAKPSSRANWNLLLAKPINYNFRKNAHLFPPFDWQKHPWYSSASLIVQTSCGDDSGCGEGL